MAGGPPVEQLGKRRRLSSTGRQLAFVDEHQHEIALVSEVDDVLGHERAILGPCRDCHLRILSRAQAGFGDVQCVMAMGFSQHLRNRRREHLVDQEPQANSAWRCSATRRLSSAACSLRSINCSTGSGYAAA